VSLVWSPLSHSILIGLVAKTMTTHGWFTFLIFSVMMAAPFIRKAAQTRPRRRWPRATLPELLEQSGLFEGRETNQIEMNGRVVRTYSIPSCVTSPAC
jgi:hypothetical protein